MPIRKTSVTFDIADIEAPEIEAAIDNSAGIPSDKMVSKVVDGYITAYKHGREVRIPKGQMLEILAWRGADGKRVFTMRRPDDWVEPESMPCLIASCTKRIASPMLTTEQEERNKFYGTSDEEWLKAERRMRLRGHMRQAHYQESLSHFPEEK